MYTAQLIAIKSWAGYRPSRKDLVRGALLVIAAVSVGNSSAALCSFWRVIPLLFWLTPACARAGIPEGWGENEGHESLELGGAGGGQASLSRGVT